MLSRNLKMCIKSAYFMRPEDVDSLDQIMDYCFPIQQAINYVSANYTAYEVNGLLSFIDRNFGQFTKAEFVRNRLRLIRDTKGVEIEINPGDCKEFSLVDNPAVGFVRLKK